MAVGRPTRNVNNAPHRGDSIIERNDNKDDQREGLVERERGPRGAESLLPNRSKEREYS